MSHEDEFIYQLLSCKSTEYQESFNCKDDTNILAHSATKIIQEVQNTAVRGGCESHPGALLSAMLDHAPCLQGQRYVAVVLHVARRHSPEMVIVVAKTWRNLFLDITSQFIKAKQLPKLDIHEEFEGATKKELKNLIEKVAERERYHCAISGNFDVYRVDQLLIQRHPLPSYTTVATMQPVYVVPPSPSLFESHEGLEKKTVALMRAVFKAWTRLDSLKINDPSNTIYTTPNFGMLFRRFVFYLKAESKKPNAYRAYDVMGKLPLFHGMPSTDVVFHNSDEEGTRRVLLFPHPALSYSMFELH